METPSVCIFGEVLLDCFPDGRQILGGAPFNVSWHLQAFGAAPRFVSAVGEDEEGARIRSGMRDWGMDTTELQTDPDHPTGQVQVSIQDGEPSYDILLDCAYDFIRTPTDASGCGLLYHGTLALRRPVSAATLRDIKSSGPDLIFLDVNLREPWWSRDPVLTWVTEADWVKLNRDELLCLSDPAPTSTDIDMTDLARAFLERHRLKGLVVTLGEAGALALTPETDAVLVAPQPALEVVDTVGAGDAFAAVTILGITQGWSLETTLERAQTFASRVVGQRGATAAQPDFYRPLIEGWGLHT
ncbi:carbohydrate kinase family protein [Imhoffiella purpurea]|uniref:Fructokinase n=1 Tax=Imhoffiella purpurea TaxID=1249627 RepID=W9VEP6_9GAMM|nr:carbohydrate kinase [Imhoffiella purpurea]EXJ15456.1 Fructokinase [Imhoffiella purpurea]